MIDVDVADLDFFCQGSCSDAREFVHARVRPTKCCHQPTMPRETATPFRHFCEASVWWCRCDNFLGRIPHTSEHLYQRIARSNCRARCPIATRCVSHMLVQNSNSVPVSAGSVFKLTWFKLITPGVKLPSACFLSSGKVAGTSSFRSSLASAPHVGLDQQNQHGPTTVLHKTPCAPCGESLMRWTGCPR